MLRRLRPGQRRNINGRLSSTKKENMEYRLVMSDLDGTLVDNAHKLLPETERSIRGLVESGRFFAIGSARKKSYMVDTYTGLSEICCAHACTNRTYVETSDGEVLVDAPVERDDLSLLMEACRRIKASYICCSQTTSMAKTYDPRIAQEFEYYHGKFFEEETIDRSKFNAYLMSVVTTEPRALPYSIQPEDDEKNPSLPLI